LFYGEKVTLRAIRREDLPRFVEFRNDPKVLLAVGDTPLPKTIDHVQKWFEKQLDDQCDIRFAIEADNKCIGHAGLRDVDHIDGHAELSIAIGDTEYWGRGYGRDAIRVLLDYAFRLLNLRRVWLETHAENERAIRAYRACGFVEEGRMREHIWLAGRHVDAIIMGVMRDEYHSSGHPDQR
jgi:RimJ/RimL family protein N-acetyltransferase